MEAIILRKANDFGIENREMPEIDENELILKVECTAICGTDIRILEGKKTKDVRYPSIIGHEISGSIYQIGKNVKGFHQGDRVAIANVASCHMCASCRNDHENICINRTALGYEYDGGFAEYMRIPEIFIKNGNVFRMPDKMSYREGALLEPLACCIRGQINADVSMGKNVIIIGAGPIGLLHVKLSKLVGVSNVIVIEPNEDRRTNAYNAGADIVFESLSESTKRTILKETDEVGADVVIMAAGINAVVNDALDICSKGGTVNLFAGFPKDELGIIDFNKIHYKEIKMTGSSAYKLRDYKKAFNLVSQNKLKIDDIVTHSFSRKEFLEAYNMCKSGKSLKVVIEG